MALMRYTRQRTPGGTYYVVMPIPAKARHLFGDRKQVWKSLHTRDKAEALRRGAPLIAEMLGVIESASLGAAVVEPRSELSVFTPTVHALIAPEAAFAALRRWRTAEIEKHYAAAFNGQLPVWAMSQHWFERTKRLQDLKAGRFIPHFSQHLAEALSAQGIPCTQTHPALGGKLLRDEFTRLWSEVEERYCDFARGEFDAWREVRAGLLAEQSSAVSHSAPLPIRDERVPGQSGVRLLDLFDRFSESKGGTVERRRRGYVQRLAEFLGDPEITTITPAKMDDFKVALRKFPNTKRAIDHIPFSQVIEQFQAEEGARQGATYRRLAQKTIWGWFATYNELFRYGVRVEAMPRNPVQDVMPVLDKAAAKQRLVYDDADIAAIFSAPLFMGGSSATGYGQRNGTTPVRDEHYWLPVFCLWHGTRLEEIGGAKAADVKLEGQIWFLDLRSRVLKTAESRRQVPLHPRIISLGFLEYVRSQPASGFLFPNLPHDLSGRQQSTRLFSKRWGRWCRATAPVPGEGIDDPRKVFHSFRHTFKRACRDARISEEFHDLLTGHRGLHHAGRDYGKGVSLEVLAQEIAKVDYPTFPRLPPLL